jgi:hypothetical protein
VAIGVSERRQAFAVMVVDLDRFRKYMAEG